MPASAGACRARGRRRSARRRRSCGRGRGRCTPRAGGALEAGGAARRPTSAVHDVGGRGGGAAPAGEQRAGSAGRHRDQSRRPQTRRSRAHTSADDLQHAVAEDDLLGRAALALRRAAARSAGSPGTNGTIDSSNHGMRGVGAPRRPSRTPTGSTPTMHHARRDRADVAEVRVGVLAERGAGRRPCRSPTVRELGVALAGHHEQRAEGGDDEEPVRDRHVGGRRAPAMARSTKPAATATRSSTATCFSQIV